MAINKVIYGNNTLIDINDTTATESDVAQGVVFYKADGTRSVGTMAGSSSFVGMVVQGTNLTTEADVKAIYGASTSWTLISSVALASANVYGNGNIMAVWNGVNTAAITSSDSYNRLSTAGTAGDVVDSTTKKGGNGTLVGKLGLATKTALGNIDSGVIVDTITVYSWERTA